MNYYPFHIGDYASATRHLSWDEDAAYRRLLDVYYTSEKPIPSDHRAACRLVLAQTDAQRDAVQIVLSEFFELTEDGWVNKRADAEIEEMRARQQKQRDKANKRWHPHGEERGTAPAMPQHKQPDAAASTGDAVAMPPTPTPTPTPTPIKPPTPLPGGFVAFWNAWPQHHRKAAKPQCARKWEKDGCEQMAGQIVAAVNRAKRSDAWLKNGGEFIPAPLVWLNQARWDAPAESAATMTVPSEEAGKTAELLAKMAAVEAEAQTPEAHAARRAVMAKLGRIGKVAA